MNKKGLVNTVHIKLYENGVNYPKWELEQIVDAVLSSIEESLQHEEEVFLTRFGRFEIIERKGRRYRHPKTKELCNSPASKAIAFRVHKGFKFKEKPDGLLPKPEKE